MKPWDWYQHHIGWKHLPEDYRERFAPVDEWESAWRKKNPTTAALSSPAKARRMWVEDLMRRPSFGRVYAAAFKTVESEELLEAILREPAPEFLEGISKDDHWTGGSYITPFRSRP